MCRHLAYLGPPRTLAELITEPPHSLYEQSWNPRLQTHGTVNADGFGIGWYPPGDDRGPVRYRRSIPIWNDPNLPGLLNVLRSGAVLAAVRAASPGTGREETAPAPYGTGRWLFSHNGTVEAWGTLPADTGEPLTASELLGLEARTDSALLWLMTNRRLTAGLTPADALADVVHRVRSVRPGARLSLLLTDGRTLAAVRHGESLWYHAAGGRLTVASEPPPDHTDWHEIPDRTLFTAPPLPTVPAVPSDSTAHQSTPDIKPL
ncbi:ergothioneine biosynthesis protein EgtC [Streptomyces sp. RFCAC02]|uniref:ergothioneine biosynthesis protein EgtC n=1 Tax=Streptomyces sp. RFCAC02 TaxID=2499143 RepID=UPI00101F7319|nr:ergothioneine biosynthesis protein EgtC [Streptomyces sp. RFCAC02]